MVLKGLGIVLVIFSCSGLGFFFANRLKERLTLLEQLRRMIGLLKGEILYANSPLDEALLLVGEKSKGVLGDFFIHISHQLKDQDGELFFSVWEKSVEALDRNLPLSSSDREGLKSLGEHLGYLDLGMQERTLLFYTEQLEDSILQLRGSISEKTKLCTSLGIMGGLFLSVVLV